MVIYNGFYTKIMQRNYNQTLFSRDLLNYKKSVAYQMIDRISRASFFGSLAVTVIVLIMAVVNSKQFKKLQFISGREANHEFFAQLGYQLSYAFEIVPIGLYILYDLACFLTCAQIENLWEKLFNNCRATIKAYVTALQIKCKKRGPRASRKEQLSQFVRSNSPTMKFEKSKLTLAVGRGATRKPTHQSAELANEPNLSESGRISPPNSIKNLGDITVRNSTKKTTIGKTNMIQNSDITSQGSSDFIKIIDYGVIPDLGSVDHVVFDKTDTLTTSHLEIVSFATVSRCYSIECAKISEKLVEISTPGNNLALNDSQDEEVKERGSYSEKSQEYLDEIEGDYRAEVCDEDSTWTAMIRNLEQPSYNLDVGGHNYGSNAHLTALGQSIDESPAMKNNPTTSVTAFFNERSRGTKKTGFGGALGDDLLNMSNQNNLSMKKKNTLVRGALDDKGQSKSMIGGINENMMSSRNMVNDLSANNSDSNRSTESSTFKLLLKPSKVYPMDKFIRDVYFKREDIEMFMSMIALFNRFTLEGERNSKAQAMEDKAISEVLKHLGYQLSASKKNKETSIDSEFRIKSLTTNHTVDYKVVGVNFFSHSRERASIVFNDTSNNSGEAYILVKGVERSMISLLTMNDKEKNILRELNANYKSQGLKQIIYGIKKLEYAEVLSFRGSYMEIMKSPRDQKEGFELLAMDVEKNLKFIGCFGIRDNVCPEGLAFSQVMRDIGIKFSILSGDNKDNCLNIARTLELTKSGMEESGITFSISSTEEDEIIGSMKRIVDQIHEDMKKLNQDEMKRADRDVPQNQTAHQMVQDNIKQRLFKSTGDSDHEWHEETQQEFLNFEFDPLSFRNLTKRTLLLNGESVNKIVNTPFLLTQFRSVLLFCSSVVGYSMQPSHKATIVKLLRSNNSVVLAVGDGFNDIRMIREANVGVQISNVDVPVVFSDIVVGGIAALRKAMFSTACSFNKNLVMGILSLYWIMLTQLYFVSMLYAIGSDYSEIFRSDTKVLRLVFLLVICACTLFDEPYRSKALEAFPILYRESVISRRHFKALFLAVVVLGLIEVSIIYSIFMFFVSNNFSSRGYTRGITFFENYVVLVTSVNACIKIYLLRTDNKPILSIVLAIIAIGIYPIVLAEAGLVTSPDPFTLSDLFSDYMVLASMCLSIIMPNIINWTMITMMHRNNVSYLVHHLTVMNKLIEKHPDKGNSKKVSTNEKKQFLNDSLKEAQLKRYIGAFQVTNLVNMVRKVCHAQSMSVSMGKIISIDLFNYQIGLKKFSNYIMERVDRRRFRDYLMHIMKKNTRIQLILYLIMYIAAMVVGLSTASFRGNYMLDTVIPYMILMIGGLIAINASEVYYSKLFKYFIAMGIVSFVLSVIFSSITYNRFELNLVDLYNSRIWFSVCLEMIEASILVILHLILRVIW
jgi:magnesium-transporting ATPase (P-type)